MLMSFPRISSTHMCVLCGWIVVTNSLLGCANNQFSLPPQDEETIDTSEMPNDQNSTTDNNANPEPNPQDADPDATPIEDEPITDSATIIPDNSYCSSVVAWDEASNQFEQEVFTLVNIQRSQGANCGSAGTFSATGSLTMDGALQCAARNHSKDMNQRGYFSHSDPDGLGPDDRLALALYEWSGWGENIAQGQPTPDAVVQAWMQSDGHCSNIMNPFFTEIGIGHYDGNYWTQSFGSPR